MSSGDSPDAGCVSGVYASGRSPGGWSGLTLRLQSTASVTAADCVVAGAEQSTNSSCVAAEAGRRVVPAMAAAGVVQYRVAGAAKL